MPLWRFKAGDFSSPVEATLGIKPTIVSPPEGLRSAAIEEVEALKAKLTEMTGTPIDWSDNGDVHYNKQFHDPSVLQVFAAWYDHRNQLPEFLPAPGLRYGKHPVRQLPKPAKRRFPILAEHSLHTGYLLPIPFEGIHYVEPFKSWGDREFFHDVASTQTVLRELADLLKFIATVPEIREPEHGSIPVADARWYAEELQRICTLSVKHHLPVIFYG